MKKLIILSAIAFGALFYNNTANAQLRVHIGLGLPRIFVRPAVAVEAQPVAYYNNDAADYDPADDYYYLPDVDAYYNVADQDYYYYDGENWVSADCLPGEYANYDWRNAAHFEVRAPRPYLHNDFYMNRFHGAGFNWARYNAPRGGYANQRFDNHGYDQHFDNRGGFANRDNRPMDNRGFDGRGDRGGFDNRGQNFDNSNREGFQGRDQNQNRPQQFGQNEQNRPQQQQQQFGQNDQNRPQQFNNNQGGQQNRGNNNQFASQNNGGHQQNGFEQNNNRNNGSVHSFPGRRN